MQLAPALGRRRGRRRPRTRSPPSAPAPAARSRSCDFWEHYEEDIELAARLGINAFRFSFEWARFQPHGPGTPLEPEAVAKCVAGRLLAHTSHPLPPKAPSTPSLPPKPP